MSRSRGGWPVVALALALAAPVSAQEDLGFAIDRFEPAERGSDWFVLESLDWGHGTRPSIGVLADYASRPLVVYDPDDKVKTIIVENQLFTHVGAALAIGGRLRFGVSLPVALTQSGKQAMVGATSFPPPDAAAVGDVRLSLDLRLVGLRAFSLGLGASVFVPTGSREQYSGDEKVRVLPHLLAGGRGGPVQWGLKAGFFYRGLQDDINGAPLGSELTMAGALGLRLANERLLLGPEVFASTVVSESGAAFSRRATPLEALLGLHIHLGGVTLRAGGGVGLTRGLGSPRARVVAGLEWTPVERKRLEPPPPPPAAEPAPPPEEPVAEVAPQPQPEQPAEPPPPPPPPGDRDGDTVLDADDACPDSTGTPTSDPKTNGCPSARIDQEQIIIAEQIKFKTNSAVILPESEIILLAVREILNDHPEIVRLRVEGHTDDRGKARANKRLSQRRAQAVARWLTKYGVAKKRVYALGFGQERPVADNHTEEGRRDNRRVELHIERRK